MHVTYVVRFQVLPDKLERFMSLLDGVLDAMRSAGGAPRAASAARSERASTHYFLLPLIVFNAERPSTNAQLARAYASVETLHKGVLAAQRA